MLLQGKTALITGASRGIGAAIARAFVQHGCRVMLVARSAAVEELARELGDSATAMCADVADPASAKLIVQSCKERLGGLDILVNNAGKMNLGILGMIRDEAISEVLDTNLRSTIHLTQNAVRLLLRSQSGSVINLSSISGVAGNEGMSAYCAAKAAIIGFTKASAKELAPRGVRVNAVAPGFIDTDMTRELPEKVRESTIAGIRMGRAGSPEEVAGVCVFLASDLSAYVTGQIIGVDGGMQA